MLMLAVLFLSYWVANAANAQAAGTGLQHDVVFRSNAPLARNDELLRRLRSPLERLQIELGLAGNPGVLHAWPLDPSKQHFALYVPPAPPPPGGYALMVFVPPWDEARVPLQWLPVLNRNHMIFVSAGQSGNDANVLERREPLALLAEYNVARRYPIDPERVYVGGFSGGSRIALRLALAYPDVFRGALLDAGSDPIGTAQIPLPPTSLLHRFQQSSRIVFLTGDHDNIRQMQLAQASAALRRWCVFSVASVTMLHTPHVLAGVHGFDQALNELSRRRSAPDRSRLAACRRKNNGQLDAQLAQAQAMLHAHETGDARSLLVRIDAAYGALAAPRSVTLMRSLERQP